MYDDELHNTTSTPCVNVTILDDNIPENKCYIAIDLLTLSNEIGNVAVVPGKNQTTIAILDDDHGTFGNIILHLHLIHSFWKISIPITVKFKILFFTVQLLFELLYCVMCYIRISNYKALKVLHDGHNAQHC